METLTINTYSIHELSQDAAEYAIEQERQERYQQQHPWADDAYDSLRKFCEWFDVEVREHPHSWTGEVWLKDSELNEWLEGNCLDGLQGERLRRWIDRKYGSVLRKPKVYGDKYGSGKKRTSRIMTEETNCPFTGYYMDEALLDPIRRYVNLAHRPAHLLFNVYATKGMPKHYTYGDVMDECISAFNFAITADYEHWLSDECIVEDMDCNDWRFTEDGRRTYAL